MDDAAHVLSRVSHHGRGNPAIRKLGTIRNKQAKQPPAVAAFRNVITAAMVIG
jgi:hypothetical protein